MVKPERIVALENTLDELNLKLAHLEEFILPGGTRGAAYCHLARTICRRAERSLVKLSREESITETSIQYLNRLSDLLFVMCRSINQAANLADVLWHNKKA
jgi:cob(I)alamin adenosyltransferase